MILEVEALSVGYGRDPVLQSVDLDLLRGEIVTLVGANGAGKSTLLKAISGLMRPMRGRIRFEGRDLAGLGPAERLRLGIAHVPEGRQVFGGMSIRENLALGGYLGAAPGRFEEVCALFPMLRDRLDDAAGNLSGGQQQMLAIARGLMSGPRVLLLDEPSLGLSPLLVHEVFRLVAELRARGLAILLAEQNARAALAIADRGTVIENGRVALAGPAQELLHSAEIAARYLGVGAAHRTSDAERKLAADLRACLDETG
jgi:branched-chain amino acid transport system ATP-binding protein